MKQKTKATKWKLKSKKKTKATKWERKKTPKHQSYKMKKKGSQKEKKKDKENAKKSYLHQSCSTAPSHLISGVCEKTNKQTIIKEN